jgi:two-component system KDP operon response regulator KdpE
MTSQQTTVLLVEDDQNIVDLVRANLTVRGFDVVTTDDQATVERLVGERRPDIVLLDLMLPDADGFELCRQIREHSSVGIIVVSARRGERDKVRALNLGADDYMTKPFGIEELLARITATLRRTRPPGRQATEQGRRLVVGSIAIDFEAQLVTRDGVPVHLTPTEYALLEALARRPGTLLPHATLLREVWGVGYETQTEYTRVYVRRLRAKLEDPEQPPLILTEPRAGYRLRAPVTEQAASGGSASPR